MGYCKRCGRKLAADKRFCGGCGQPVATPEREEHSIAPGSAWAAAPMNASCRECGAALTPGKRFCKQCGHAIEPAPAALTETASPAKRERKENADVIPQPSSAAPARHVLPLSGSRPPAARAKLAFVIAAAVLAVAGVGLAWYIHAHRCVSCATKESNGTLQPGTWTQAANQTPPAASAPEQANKPSASTREGHIPAAAQAPSKLAPAARPASLPPVLSLNARESAHGNPAGPTPVFQQVPAPSLTPIPAGSQLARSGVRHYQGPPVPYGGVVVFDNLPKARLRFTFDGAAWRLIIKPNPDGTKKVILNSLKQGYQTSCDLGWEIAD
jgi:rubredoxin